MQRQLQRVRVTRDQLADQVDLLEGGRHRRVALELGRDEDRPELAADAALGQPRQVGVGELDRPAMSGRPAVAADLASRSAQGRSLCPSMIGKRLSRSRAAAKSAVGAGMVTGPA